MRARWVLKSLQCVADETHRWQQLLGPGKTPVCPTCGAEGVRPDPIAPMSATVFGDTLWGGPQFIENLSAEPVWCETKSEYRALLAQHGMVNRVRHVPIPGTDKSPVTTTWDIGLPPGCDPRPFAMLPPELKIERRKEAATRFGCTVDELARLSANLESASLEVVHEPTPSVEFYPER